LGSIEILINYYISRINMRSTAKLVAGIEIIMGAGVSEDTKKRKLNRKLSEYNLVADFAPSGTISVRRSPEEKGVKRYCVNPVFYSRPVQGVTVTSQTCALGFVVGIRVAEGRSYGNVGEIIGEVDEENMQKALEEIREDIPDAKLLIYAGHY